MKVRQIIINELEEICRLKVEEATYAHHDVVLSDQGEIKLVPRKKPGCNIIINFGGRSDTLTTARKEICNVVKLRKLCALQDLELDLPEPKNEEGGEK